jgi:hypothetical protein
MYALMAFARCRLGELGHDHGDDHRGRDGPSEPLQEARGDQEVLILGQAAERRRQCEQRHAAEEDALAPDQIAEPPGQQQEAPECDQVGVDDPRQIGLSDVEIALDDGQRDVHDGAVQRVHEHGHADDGQSDPAAAIAGGDGCGGAHQSRTVAALVTNSG